MRTQYTLKTCTLNHNIKGLQQSSNQNRCGKNSQILTASFINSTQWKIRSCSLTTTYEVGGFFCRNQQWGSERWFCIRILDSPHLQQSWCLTSSCLLKAVKSVTWSKDQTSVAWALGVHLLWNINGSLSLWSRCRSWNYKRKKLVKKQVGKHWCCL